MIAARSLRLRVVASLGGAIGAPTTTATRAQARDLLATGEDLLAAADPDRDDRHAELHREVRGAVEQVGRPRARGDGCPRGTRRRARRPSTRPGSPSSAARAFGEPRSTGTPPSAVKNRAPSGCWNISCLAMKRIRRLVTNAANGRVEVRAVGRRDDVRARRRHVLGAHDAHPEQDAAQAGTIVRAKRYSVMSPPGRCARNRSTISAHHIVDRSVRSCRAPARRRPRGAARPPGPSRAHPGGRATPAPRPPPVDRAAACSSRWRRLARSSSLAVRNTFTGASGNTTVPMSRPSTTPPPCSSHPGPLAAHELPPDLGMRRDGRHRAR